MESYDLPIKQSEYFIPSLDGITDLPNGQRAMRGYIALSRAEDAEGLVIAEPFAPTLFQKGPAADITS